MRNDEGRRLFLRLQARAMILIVAVVVEVLLLFMVADLVFHSVDFFVPGMIVFACVDVTLTVVWGYGILGFGMGWDPPRWLVSALGSGARRARALTAAVAAVCMLAPVAFFGPITSSRPA